MKCEIIILNKDGRNLLMKAERKFYDVEPISI
jgi:hypothetical protein